MQNKKILFAVIPEKGHINPFIGTAQHLQMLGYELAFFSQQDLSPQLRKAGLHCPVYAHPNGINIDADFITRGAAFVERLKDKQRLRQWIKTLLIDAIPAQIELLHEAQKDFRAELIVADPMIYAAAIVAKGWDIPWAGISTSLNPVTPDEWSCELTETIRTFDAERRSLFERYGIKPRFKVSDAVSPWLNSVWTTEAYAPRKSCCNDFSFYLGSCLPPHQRGDEGDFPFHRLDPEAKKIYMSLGSQIYYHPELFLAIAHAFRDSQTQLIFSINELINSSFIETLPDNVLAVHYTPQLELLKQMDLFITHGGANSVMESLVHGVPLALLPICNDQFLQAEFIKRAGVGIVLNPHSNSKEYRELLLPLLKADSPQRKNAAIIADSFKRYGGAKGAATLIEELLLKKQPLSPCL